MIELRITEEMKIVVQEKNVLFRGFILRSGNKNNFGFETEYSDGRAKYRKVFKNAADSSEEIHRIIVSLAENEVLPSVIEEVMEEMTDRVC